MEEGEVMRAKSLLIYFVALILLCGSVTGSVLDVTGSYFESAHVEEHKCMESSSKRTSGEDQKVLVLVNTSVYKPLRDELEQYRSDLRRRGWSVEIVKNEYSTAEQLRGFLKDRYDEENIDGTFFVGQLPHAEYEISHGFEGYCRFPIDHFYTDLNGTWRDTDGNGVYDEHTDQGGDLDPEIWFGRLCMKTDWASEVSLYENYFDKVHSYRNGSLTLPHSSLLYVDDDWKVNTCSYESGLRELYDNITVVNDKTVTNASDYGERIQSGYEWLQIHCHANHSPKRHAFKINDGPKGSGGNFTSHDLFTEGQRSLFANIFTCGSADYTAENYLCGWYALTEDYGLANVGTTKPGSMLDFYDYYRPLSEGKCLGKALQEWWKKNAESSRVWFYGMTTIGDPTLSPVFEPGVQIAEAGEDRTVYVGDQFTLNASATPEDATVKSYTWTIQGEEYHGKRITEELSSPGTYNVTLTVEDEYGNRVTDDLTITVEEDPDKEGVWWVIYLIPAVIVITIITGLWYKIKSSGQLP